jgi:FkbM family methyltransferase
MRTQVAAVLAQFYDRASRSGILERPLARRTYESAYLAYKRFIEAGPVDSLRPLAPPGSMVIDVGANIGFFALRFAGWVGPTGHVIAIEPESRNVASLRRRIARAGFSDVVTCVQAAAADRPGTFTLALNPGHPGDHHLGQEGEPVAAVTIDELAATEARPITLVKIDVQGAESLVVAGAAQVIDVHRPALFVEIDGGSLARLGSSQEELIDTLGDLGYEGHTLTRGGIGARLEPSELVARSTHDYIDVLFLPTVS